MSLKSALQYCQKAYFRTLKCYKAYSGRGSAPYPDGDLTTPPTPPVVLYDACGVDCTSFACAKVKNFPTSSVNFCLTFLNSCIRPCEVFSLRFFILLSCKIKTCYKKITCDRIETRYEHVSMISMTIEIVLCILNVN